MSARPVLLIVALGAVSMIARADDRTYNFDCDAPAGHYSSFSASTKAAALTITGSLRIHELHPDKKWDAVVNVMIYGGTEGKIRFGFRAYDVDQTRKTLHLVLLKPGGHIDVGKDSLKPGKQSVPFRLELTATGTLSVDVGGARQSTEIGAFKPTTVDLGCSTGDFSFDDVRIEEKSP